MKQIFRNLIDEFKYEVRNVRSFQSLVLSTIIVIGLLAIYTQLKVISSLLILVQGWWIVSYYIYKFKYKQKVNPRKDADNLFDFYIISINIVYFILMVVVYFNNPTLQAYTLISGMTVLYALPTILVFYTFLKVRRKIYIILPVYITLICMSIVLFGLIYWICSVASPLNEGVFSTINQTSLTQLDNFEKISSRGDYIYFSFSVFFASSFGDFVPLGSVMRWIVFIETIFSVVILTSILNRILSREENEEAYSSSKFKSEVPPTHFS